MPDENPQKLALEWLNNILARVREVEAENKRLLEIIARKPTGTKTQREQQMLKRMEAAEAECASLRETKDKFMWQVRDTCKRAEAAEAECARLRAALERRGEAIFGRDGD
jgi:tRNA C32,U32 (ribose-2'-O)-methylase TrmJ